MADASIAPLSAALNGNPVQDQLDIEIPKKQSVIREAGDQAFKLAVATTALGSLFNVSHQRAQSIKAFKKTLGDGLTKEAKATAIEGFVKKGVIDHFDVAGHGKWALVAMAAGLAGGAALGGMAADAHNKKVDGFRARLEAEEAARVLAAQAQQGAAKG